MKQIKNSWETKANRFSIYGFTDMPTIKSKGPTILTYGKGPYVYDVHSREYLDANSGLWNMVAGFNHPGLIEVAKAQYDRMPGYHAFFGRMCDKTVLLSEKLIEISPFKSGKVFYTNSGSEANDTMVKILWFIHRSEGNTSKTKIITRKNAYHGVTAVSASMTGKPYNQAFGLPLPGFIHLTCPHYWREAENGETETEFSCRLGEELERIIKTEDPNTIAGFFAEPVLGAGGVIPPPDGYFQIIQKILKKYSIPMISDEVICGFGRTGFTWGCNCYDFVPDAIISSKNLTAGYFPMGAVMLGSMLADRVKAAAEKAEEFPHGFTSSGHPVGSAIALKAIDIITEDGLAENVNNLSPYFKFHMKRLGKHENIGEVRFKGFMGALEVVKYKDTKTPFEPSLAISERIATTCSDFGLICRPLGQSIILCPAFIYTKNNIDEMFEKLEKSLGKVFKSLKKV